MARRHSASAADDITVATAKTIPLVRERTIIRAAPA